MTNSIRTVAVLGTGRMGRAIGMRIAETGAKVIYGCREPKREDIAALLADTSKRGAATANASSITDATNRADWIILATPYSAMQSVLDDMGDIGEKLLIDLTNALKMGDDGLMEMATDTSAGEEIQAANPNAKVIKAFNTIGFHIVADPAAAGGPVSALLAGNDITSKAVVAELAHELGFEAHDVGPIRQARYLEGMSALYLTPYLQGRISDAFEYFLRGGASPKESKGVRSAG